MERLVDDQSRARIADLVPSEVHREGPVEDLERWCGGGAVWAGGERRRAEELQFARPVSADGRPGIEYSWFLFSGQSLRVGSLLPDMKWRAFAAPRFLFECEPNLRHGGRR